MVKVIDVGYTDFRRYTTFWVDLFCESSISKQLYGSYRHLKGWIFCVWGWGDRKM